MIYERTLKTHNCKLQGLLRLSSSRGQIRTKRKRTRIRPRNGAGRFGQNLIFERKGDILKTIFWAKAASEIFFNVKTSAIAAHATNQKQKQKSSITSCSVTR